MVMSSTLARFFSKLLQYGQLGSENTARVRLPLPRTVLMAASKGKSSHLMPDSSRSRFSVRFCMLLPSMMLPLKM